MPIRSPNTGSQRSVGVNSTGKRVFYSFGTMTQIGLAQPGPDHSPSAFELAPGADDRVTDLVDWLMDLLPGGFQAFGRL